MKLFLDTANVEEIRAAVRLGVLSGVTTNPSLMAKEGDVSFRDTIREICSLVDGPVSAEAVSLDAEGLLAEAREIATWAPNVVVKIPCTAAGIETISVLGKENIHTNMTLCFSVNQAIMGAQAGASFVSPFIGRIDDMGQDGMAVLAEIMDVYRSYDFSTQVMAASIRHPLHVVMAAKAGADVCTMPYKVLLQMIEHPLTSNGIARFLEDWNRLRIRARER